MHDISGLVKYYDSRRHQVCERMLFKLCKLKREVGDVEYYKVVFLNQQRTPRQKRLAHHLRILDILASK